MKEFLAGKKTYIICALMFIVAGLHAIRSQVPILASISDETWQEIMAFIQGGGGMGMLGMFLRMGVKKAELP